MIFAESPRRQKVSRLVSWGHWFAFFNIIIALVIASIYVFSAPFPDNLLGQIYLIANWFGHISFITFIGFVIFILPMCYMLENIRFVKTFASFIAAVGLALLAFDALLFNRTGLHLSLRSSELIVDETASQIALFSWQEWAFLSLLFIVWFGFQLLMANALWKRIERFSRKRVGQSVIGLFLFSFIGSHALHVWADARLYQPIMLQDNMFPLSYPSTAKTTLSRYGLLNITDYEQQKSVQFTYNIEQLAYPKEPLYCPIDRTSSWVILYVTDAIDPSAALPTEWSSTRYFRPSNTLDVLVKTALFSLPNLYHHYLKESTPVIVDVLSGIKLPIHLYSPSNTGIGDNKIITLDFSELTRTLEQPQPGITFAFINASQLGTLTQNIAIMSESSTSQNWLIMTPNLSNKGVNGMVWSNKTLSQQVMIDEDIVPSIFAQLGCDVNPTIYSTGQNIFGQARDWQVTTENDSVILLNGNYVAKIKSNGLTEIQSKASGNQLNQKLNTDMFNRAIKHISQFSQIK